MQNTIKVNNKEYTILYQIGQGATGKVFKAQYQNELYAIKKQEYFGEGELEFYDQLIQQKFKRCKNLIQIYDFEQIGRFSYIVMELGDSCLYNELIQNKIDQKNIRFIIKQIGSGIKELHEMGLAHRDLKPENILIKTLFSNDKNESQQVFKICDFGVVKNISNLKTKAVGTPYYLAPELLTNNNDNYSTKCDIWSFGILIYEILTRQLMFQGKTFQEISNAILSATDDDISDKINKLKIEVDYKELLKNMLKVDSQKRYNIDRVLEALKPKSRSTSRQRQNNFVMNPPPQISIRSQFKNRDNQLSQSPFKQIQNFNIIQQQYTIQKPQQYPNKSQQNNQSNVKQLEF
ncbi:unnamed protein product [Paramecium pentaurelia]|uniref:Protein kinase domain-containing protein n=1 Tax=Paramecium pentaurelia TaxID=43138 RepID=A0A8S1SQE2_9CILI|nr:unnamed protein product [Paramecium pentaurelia]